MRDNAFGPRAWFLGCCLTAGLIAASPAHAWVQYRTADQGGCGLRWYGPTKAAQEQVAVTYALDQRGLDGMSASEVEGAVAAAFEQWASTPCGLCASSEGPGCAPVGCGKQPLGITFVSQGWKEVTDVGACAQRAAPGGPCQKIVPNGNFLRFAKDTSEWGQSKFVFALTFLTFNKSSGEIVDADILFDDADFDFCGSDCKAGENSLCNTITHEIGHFLGMDHSQFSEATMYATAPAGETKKCTLHEDDRQGVCTAYRTACSSQGCPGASKPVSPGCQAGASAAPVGLFVGLLCVAGLVGRRFGQRRRARLSQRG